MPTSRIFILKSSDDKTFSVEEAVARESETIGHLIDGVRGHPGAVIPLPNVTSRIMSMVIRYCKKHVEANQSNNNAAAREEELRNFDANFVRVDQDILIDIILAANYLNIKSLLDLTCQAMADMMKENTGSETQDA